MLRELHAADKTWFDHIPVRLSAEDDGSLLKLNLSDILAVDLSNITEPNAR